MKMKRALVQDLFNLTMWQHNGAKPHQANVFDFWLDRMNAIMSRSGGAGTPGPPHLRK